MNTDAIIPKINIQGSTINEPLITFIQNYKWNYSNYCLVASNGYTYLNGVIINGNENTNNIYINNNNLIFGITNSTNNNNFIFSFNSNEKIRINSNGYLGINNNNPQYHLDITGSINITSIIYKNNVNLDNIYLNIKNNFWIYDSSKNNIFVDINSNINNVGIGTSLPLGTLHIGSTDSINQRDTSFIISKYDVTTSTNYNCKFAYVNDKFIIGNSNLGTNPTWNKQLSININAPTNSLVIDNIGNIGINTDSTSGTNKLIVNGGISASSLSGIGSNITQLDYNNITINKPDTTNLNNWIIDKTNNNNVVYNVNNSIGIGTSSTKYTSASTGVLLYQLNVFGTINCSFLRINNELIDTLFLKIIDANANYLSKIDYPWTSNTNIYSKTNLQLKNNYNIIVGNMSDTTTTTTTTTLMNINGCLNANKIICTDGSEIGNIEYSKIRNLPVYLLSVDAISTYVSKTEYQINSNSIINTYVTKTDLNTKFTNFTDSISTILAGNISTPLIDAIAQKLNYSDYLISYNKIIQNPINIYINSNTIFPVTKENAPTYSHTFGFNTYADSTNTSNIITVGGNIVSLSNIIASNNIICYKNIQENGSNLSNIYISSNVYNNNIIYYDKIYDRKIAACTENNYYPPPNYYYNSNYSNIVSNSDYGNGLYQISTSTSVRNLEFYNQSYTDGKILKSYQLFNTSNSSNNIPWEIGDLTVQTNPIIGNYYQYDNNIYRYNTNDLNNYSQSNVTSNSANTIYGHWIQYYYSEGIILNNIEFIVISTSNAPRKISLFATNNNILNTFDYSTNWDIILSDYIINSSDYKNISYYPNTNNYPINFNFCSIPVYTNFNSYNYYRIIITELIGSPYISINQVKFKGIEKKKQWKHSGNNIYSYSNISINTVDNLSPYKLNVNGLIYSSFDIYANSNIGIGTTLPLANLHIGSTNKLSDGTIMISKNDTFNNVNLKLGYDSNYNFIIGNYNSNNNIWTSQIIINSNASSNSLLIDNNGNIGINTNSNNNNFKLNVNGSTIINNGIINQSNSFLSSAITNKFYNDIFASNNIIVSNIITSNLTANYYSTFSNILSCLSNVGIGITNNFNGSLHINTNSNNNGIWNASANLDMNKYISQFIGKNNSNNNGFYTTYNHWNDLNINNYLSFSTSNFYPIFNLTANCNIGIGITNPSGLFQIGNGGKITINKNDNSTAIFGLNNIDTLSNTKIYLNISNVEYYASSNNGNHRFYTNNTENLRIDYYGNVGIGTTNLIYKLNVNGNTFISSNLYLNSNIGVGTTNPIANIHINNGSFLLNNFKFGNSNNNQSNLIIGYCNITNNSWISQFIINSNASSNSIVISSNNYIGINNTDPIANLHIGDINKQNSTLIISQNNRNFKFGYDNNSNFIFGDFGATNNNSINQWNSQFIINYNASSNSLIIDNNGNIGINTNANNNNYKLNINGNILQNGNLSNTFNGNIGIGTNNTQNYKLNVNGNTNISSNLNSSSIYNTNKFVQTGGITRIGTSIDDTTYPSYGLYINYSSNCIDGAIDFSNCTFKHSGGSVSFSTPYMVINGDNYLINSKTTTITNELITSNQIKENGYYLSNIYVKLENLSNLSVNNVNIKKKYGYSYVMKSTDSNLSINNIQYYNNNINLNNFSKATLIDNNYQRLFNFKCFITNDNYEDFNSGFPNILQYDIYMSSNIISNNINICAIGTPENYLLSNILPTNISLIRCNSNFNYLSIVSQKSGVSFCYIVEDYLN